MGNDVRYYPQTGGTGKVFAANIPEATGLAFDSAGTLYVGSDSPTGQNSAIYTISSAGVRATFWVDMSTTDNVEVHGLAFAPNGDLYVATASGQSILKFTYPFGTNPTPTVFASGLTHPIGLTFDSSGVLLYCSNVFGPGSNNKGYIVTFTPPSNTATPVTPPMGGFCNPYGMAFDSHGNFFVSNAATSGTCSAAIVKRDATTGGWTTFATSYSTGTGTQDLEEPLGIVIDQVDNDVFVAERQLEIIVKYDSSGDGTQFATAGSITSAPHFITYLPH